MSNGYRASPPREAANPQRDSAGLCRLLVRLPPSLVLPSVIMTGHKGMDIAAAGGTPIYAAHDGRISSTTGHWTYGNVVMVDNGDGVTTLYAHMSSIAATVGQQVKKGDVIGYVGSTGRSTGNHLHFEVRINGVRQNPRNYISF